MGILTFIKSLPVLIKTAKFWIIALVIAGVISTVVWFIHDYRETLQELAVAEQTVSELTKDLKTVEGKVQDEKERTQELRTANSKISSQYLNKVRELQELKENLAMLKNDPDTAALKIESSFNNFMNDVSCITGDSTQCPE